MTDKPDQEGVIKFLEERAKNLSGEGSLEKLTKTNDLKAGAVIVEALEQGDRRSKRGSKRGRWHLAVYELTAQRNYNTGSGKGAAIGNLPVGTYFTASSLNAPLGSAIVFALRPNEATGAIEVYTTRKAEFRGGITLDNTIVIEEKQLASGRLFIYRREDKSCSPELAYRLIGFEPSS